MLAAQDAVVDTRGDADKVLAERKGLGGVRVLEHNFIHGAGPAGCLDIRAPHIGNRDAIDRNLADQGNGVAGIVLPRVPADDLAVRCHEVVFLDREIGTGRCFTRGGIVLPEKEAEDIGLHSVCC